LAKAVLLEEVMEEEDVELEVDEKERVEERSAFSS
jgi:hypothetical protein